MKILQGNLLIFYHKLSNRNKSNTYKMTNKEHGHSHTFLGTKFYLITLALGIIMFAELFIFSVILGTVLVSILLL